MKFLKAATQKMRSWRGLLLTTLFYFLFSWLTDASQFIKFHWVMTMLFLPGVTLPLITCDYKRWLPDENRDAMMLIHIVLSVAIYMLGIGIWTMNVEEPWTTFVAGAWGSLAYLVLTKYFVNAQLSLVLIFCVSILSGIVFAPSGFFASSGLWFGYCIGLWTLLNGGVVLYFTREREEQEEQLA